MHQPRHVTGTGPPAIPTRSEALSGTVADGITTGAAATGNLLSLYALGNYAKPASLMLLLPEQVLAIRVTPGTLSILHCA